MSGGGAEAIEEQIAGRTRDLGGFEVRRVLPSHPRQRVGPFIFFDHFGPVAFPPGQGMDVRPHPHIGLATVTYLFEGEIVHRDSLGLAPADPARRRELDGGGAGDRALRAHAGRARGRRVAACTGCSCG